MSRQVALDNINLEESPRWAHTEYSIEMHSEFMEKVKNNSEKPWKESLEIDFNWSINNGLINWDKTGRITDMGHAEYDEGGKDMRDSKECPFKTIEEVNLLEDRVSIFVISLHFFVISNIRNSLS